MFCLYCGTNLPDDAVFCNKCGKRQNVSSNELATEVTVLPFVPLPEGLTGSEQPTVGNVPMVQGTPSTPYSSSEHSFAQSAASASSSAPPQAESSAPLATNPHGEPQSHPSVYPDIHHYEYQAQSSHPAHHHVVSSGSKIVGHISRRAVLLGLSGA